MLCLNTPRGLPVDVPESESEDVSPKFDYSDTSSIRDYYDKNGYVVVRSVVRAEDCDRMRDLWAQEVKPSRGYLYRQATAKAEKHVFNDKNWVMNPILNLQSVDPRLFPNFRAFACDNILTAPRLTATFETLFAGEKPKIVQSMYFEGNSATWEHQDSYYLDSEKIGAMCGAWIALEDIVPRAGRFFVCPGSHKIDLGKMTNATNLADNHEVYIRSVVAKIKELGLEIRAPRLEKGDALFWSAWTIHGSLATHDPNHSRSSITCHAIPDSHRFLQWQSRIKPLDLVITNGIRIHRPKDLARSSARLVFELETRFPTAFYAAKKAALRTIVRFKNG